MISLILNEGNLRGEQHLANHCVVWNAQPYLPYIWFLLVFPDEPSIDIPYGSDQKVPPPPPKNTQYSTPHTHSVYIVMTCHTDHS